jgi:hypothetical protein
MLGLERCGTSLTCVDCVVVLIDHMFLAAELGEESPLTVLTPIRLDSIMDVDVVPEGGWSDETFGADVTHVWQVSGVLQQQVLVQLAVGSQFQGAVLTRVRLGVCVDVNVLFHVVRSPEAPGAHLTQEGLFILASA